MKLQRNTGSGYPWGITCSFCNIMHCIAIACLRCNKVFPGELIRRRDFLNGMSDL